MNTELIRAEIDNMAAGPEMDRLIAERVLGYHIYHYTKGRPEYWTVLDADGDIAEPFSGFRCSEHPSEASAWAALPQYSTDIAAAFEVAEKVGLFDAEGAEGELCKVVRDEGQVWYLSCYDTACTSSPSSEAPTPALAICRAALNVAMEVTE